MWQFWRSPVKGHCLAPFASLIYILFQASLRPQFDDWGTASILDHEDNGHRLKVAEGLTVSLLDSWKLCGIQPLRQPETSLVCYGGKKYIFKATVTLGLCNSQLNLILYETHEKYHKNNL